jgi:Family of unknown function (DUF5565)
MRKIPTIFERDWKVVPPLIIDKPRSDCSWVFAGEGVATRKLDGTCCMVRDSRLFRRREVKAGQDAPDGFEIADTYVGIDASTAKIVGWVPVGSGPEDKWHNATFLREYAEGTYELIGTHIQGDPEKWGKEELISHHDPMLIFDPQPPRTFSGLKAWLMDRDIEGIVFHHPDGRMAKIKKRDFGLKRATPATRPEEG